MRAWRVVGAVTAIAGVVALVAVVVVAILAMPVSGSSMRPALTDGDRVLLHPFGAEVERSDIVAARFGPGGPLVVKRVIALPGDAVRIVQGPTVQVRPAGTADWQTVPTPSGGWAGKPETCCLPDGRAGAGEAVVPEGMVFLLGDDPAHSDDSRAFGWAPLSEVRGVVWLRVWPL